MLRRLARSILRRWPKAAAVTRSSTSRRHAGSGFAFGISCTIDDVTLGGGVKAERLTSNSFFARRTVLAQHREPAEVLAAGLRHDALGHFLLEHQGE